jgi:succinoglycan biosynthesis transport protein ExoP
LKSRRNLPALAIANPTPAVPIMIDQPSGPDEGSPGLSMMQITTILRAYRNQTVAIVLAIALLMGGLIAAMPKTYTATTTLMVNPAGNDTAGAVGNNQASTPLFNYMSTESQLMTSAEVLLPVIDKLKLTEDKRYVGGYSGDGSNVRDYVRENLVKTIEVQLGAFASQLIYVTVSAETPQLAAKIANTLADVYLEQQRGRVSGPASERAKRYSVELAELKDKVKLAQDQVTAFRQRTGITDTTAKNNNVEQALLGSLEARLQDASNARRAAEVKASEQQSNSLAMGTMTVSTIRSTLAQQQAQLAQMRTTYGAQHPKVLELESQIQATQHNLDAELHNATSSTSSDLVAAQQLEAKMKVAVEEQRNKVLGVNKLQDDGTKYELELESAQSVYKRALEGYDQIMFASGAQVANIGIVSAAVPPQKAAKPNKPRLFLLGIVAGILVGLLAPLLYELLFNRRVRCRDDFEKDMQLPVLMEFDRIQPLQGAI